MQVNLTPHLVQLLDRALELQVSRPSSPVTFADLHDFRSRVRLAASTACDGLIEGPAYIVDQYRALYWRRVNDTDHSWTTDVEHATLLRTLETAHRLIQGFHPDIRKDLAAVRA